jgi:hypothetical protein
MAQSKFHIGNIVCNHLRAEGRTQKWLSEQIACSESNLSKILRKSSMDTGLLLQISCVLHHDFAAEISNFYHEKCKK